MAVLQMQRFSICALKKKRKAILEELQAFGALEVNVSFPEEEEHSLQKMDTVESRQTFDKNAALADNALEVLQEFAPEKTSMFSSLEGKALIDKSVYDETAERKDEIIYTANEILGLKKKLAENKAAIVKVENQIEALTPWLDLDVPMDIQGTKDAAVLIGSINSQVTLDDIYTKIAEAQPELEAMDIQMISSDSDQTCIAAVCLKKDVKEFEKALRSIGFSRPAQNIRKIPREFKQELQESAAKIAEENEQIENQIREMAVARDDLKLISDYFRVRAQKYEVLGQLPQSRDTFFISGYIPQKKVDTLRKKLESKYDIVIDVEDIPDEEEAPVLLENNKIAGSVEGVLESYGLPKKGEIDPSAIMSIFYIFFFGLMLSDAAYGLIVFIACAVVLKKFPRMSEGMQKTIRMFKYCGLSTLFWGLMFGGIFGDVVSVVSRVFFGHEVTVPPLWFEPLKDPMKLLIYSLAFGVIHLFTGLGIKGYLCIKEKKYMDFICDVVLWYMLLIGLILMLLPSQIFVSMTQMNIVFPPAIAMLSKVLAIVGAAGIVLMSGRSNKNFGLRIALGAYDLYNITGWLSDVLSYSRLLALGLATGVIASVVNQMGSMFGSGIIGMIGFLVVFVVGHTLNMAINLLGAYVHTNRLQFVEFFGKFYEGGGRPFNPFKQETKYVDIKEE